MIKKIQKLAALYMILALGACDKGFEEMNLDPNNPVTVPTAHLFSSAQRSLVEKIYGNHNFRGVDTDISVYVQYMTPLRGGGAGIYATIEHDFMEFYTEGLADLTEIIRLNSDESTAAEASESGANDNQIAVARILRVWAYQNVTDIWGDIPYSEALKGIEIALPKYDAQAEIYADFLKELDEATAQIKLNEPGIEGDLIYDGNMQNWKMFAQALKMRVGMRLTEVDPESAKKAVAEAVETGTFTSITQNALYKFLGSAPNQNPWFFHYFIQVPAFGLTNTLIDKLKAFDDPRLKFYADTAQLGGGYIGRQFGLDVASANSQRDEATSWPNAMHVISETTPFVLMSYDEVLFFQAEASARGWIDDDAEELYQKAISASMQYWGVAEDSISAYLAQPEVAFQEEMPLQVIGEQKWLALFNRSVEAWSEWRRLDYPQLQSASEAFAGRSLPRRRGYPDSEVSLNKTNYNEAIARQGPDDLSTKVWWDK